MPTNIQNIFAITDDPNSCVKRIPVSRRLQTEMTDFFTRQKNSFVNGEEEIEFSGSYNVDVGEVFTISDFELDDVISDSIRNPLNYQILDLGNEDFKVKAIFTGIQDDGGLCICFQVFDTRKILTKGMTIINSGDTYTKLSDPGLTLQDRLTSIYMAEKLYFFSYHNTRRFLDLSAYYREATDKDLDDFATSEVLKFEDEAAFKDMADSFIRKKVALLQKNKVFETISLPDIQAVASEYASFNVEVAISDGKIKVPNDKKKLKELIRFLDEDYFTTPLSKRKCVTNSKKFL